MQIVIDIGEIDNTLSNVSDAVATHDELRCASVQSKERVEVGCLLKH
jgi:hypothetical protein